ncbi:MAG TPA: general stress protein CsbD [Burkholderiales bacterium]|nr:general stress protein CsbD [Burkholderiales bacterium]
MDWERIEGQWQHFKVLAQARWGRISAADFELIAGRRDLLVTHIQQMYGISHNAAQMQLESWQGRQQEPEAA